MTTPAPHSEHYTAMLPPEPGWFRAFERREKPGQLGCTTGQGPPLRARPIPARPQGRVLPEGGPAHRRFGRPASDPVVRCDEAGRAGC